MNRWMPRRAGGATTGVGESGSGIGSIRLYCIKVCWLKATRSDSTTPSSSHFDSWVNLAMRWISQYSSGEIG